ncbi:MAG: hypothetical protein JJE50_13610 [Actinomycetales bacterium]|nr:hypothetical protein [Actinomycetales bacterium]
MWQERVEALVDGALTRALDRLGVAAEPGARVPRTEGTQRIPGAQVRRTPAPHTGDWGTAVALRVAPGRPESAPVIAAALAAELVGERDVAGVTCTAVGHVNVTLTLDALARVVSDLLRTGAPGERDPSRATPSLAVAGGQLDAVRLAHARTRMLARTARSHGVQRADPLRAELLGEPRERTLLLLLAGSRAARARSNGAASPEPMVAHLLRTAAAFEDWFAHTRLTPRGQGTMTDVHRTRLCLNDAVTPVFAGGLASLGLAAPEHL